MTTALRSTANQNNIVSHRGCFQPRGTSAFGGLQFGPRYKDDYINVIRHDSEGFEQNFALYYRVYNPTAIRSPESPPLVVVHGGP